MECIRDIFTKWKTLAQVYLKNFSMKYGYEFPYSRLETAAESKRLLSMLVTFFADKTIRK